MAQDINTIRQAVLAHIHNGYTDKVCFATADIVWVEGYQQWLLVGTDPNTDQQYWRGPENNAGHLLNYIDDEDIVDFYNEQLAEEVEQ